MQASTAVQRIAQRVLDGQPEGIESLVAGVDVPATTLWASMDRVVARFQSGELLLHEVLASAEAAHRVRRALSAPIGWRGRIVLATVEGDVHDIGAALLNSLLEASGYQVHDLGKRVSVERIVQAAAALRPDAIGLSALLASSSRQMPRCIAELDRAGLRVPVLIGGAAISRSFGRRAARLPDGRLYQPGVVYCRDVFEGLAAMAALTDPAAREAFLAQRRAEAETAAAEPPMQPGPRPAPGAPPRRDLAVPTPPFWGARRLSAGLDAVWAALDRSTLFRYHWGGYRAGEAAYARLVDEVFEPLLGELQAAAQAHGWIEPLMIRGYFPCRPEGDALVVFDPEAPARRELARLVFPRQPDGERLCLSDYFAEDGDVLPLQAVSCGPRPGQQIEQLQQAGAYRRMLFTNGLASATAEAMAELAHARIRGELGLPADQGLRFSWGYAACPDLEEQRKVLPLLRAEAELGLRLSASANLDPEHSTVALVVHHPAAKYFSVRPPTA